LGVLLSELFTEDVAPVVFGVFTLAFALASPVCNVIFMFLSRNDDPNDLIRTALVVKLIHIPSYIAVFIFGIYAALMIFMTLPLIIMLVLFDCTVLILSGSVSVFALAKNMKNNKLLSAAALVCQFFFCADIISLLVLHVASKKK
jgi:hypothetical protein